MKKLTCITCGKKFPWKERCPVVEENETVGYECGSCRHDAIVRSYHAIQEKAEARRRPSRALNMKEVDSA